MSFPASNEEAESWHKACSSRWLGRERREAGFELHRVTRITRRGSGFQVTESPMSAGSTNWRGAVDEL